MTGTNTAPAPDPHSSMILISGVDEYLPPVIRSTPIIYPAPDIIGLPKAGLEPLPKNEIFGGPQGS